MIGAVWRAALGAGGFIAAVGLIIATFCGVLLAAGLALTSVHRSAETTAPVHAAQPAACNTATAEPIVHVPVAGRPFEPLPTADGCWVLVTMAPAAAGGSGAIAVLRRNNGTVTVERTVPFKGNPSGAVLTHDGKTMIVAAGPLVAFVDVAKLISAQGDPLLGVIDTHEQMGFIYANVTRDDRWLFVSAERALRIVVVDMARVRRGALDTSAIVGAVPVGSAPIALTFSADERYLYTTSQEAPAAWGWPKECKPEAQDPATSSVNHAKGAIIVVDVQGATTAPEKAVVGAVAVGCNPVRLVTSPSGAAAYVTARGEHALHVFDTGKILSDSAHARTGRVPVGTSPVGIAVIDGGRRIILTNSNRFGGSATDPQPLMVLDASKLGAGAAAVLGTIPAGAFPRELRVTADGRTLVVSNFASRTVQFVDLARLPMMRPSP